MIANHLRRLLLATACRALALAAILVAPALHAAGAGSERPRVFVFTDINIDAGDPDDRQSLVHLLWYADELEIVGIVPERWDARGLEACTLALDAYAKDFAGFSFADRGYPDPDHLRERIARDRDDALARFGRAAAGTTPLHVLVWGNMLLCRDALRAHPETVPNLRLITIGTGLMLEQDRPGLPPDWERVDPCRQPNWNGAGRNDVFSDPRFHDLGWIEMNWTYNGMFTGDEPRMMFDRLQTFGALGGHMREVTENEPWARYFRVGDTPSVLYLIDPRRDPANPGRTTWAGRFIPHFPQQRPAFLADDFGAVPWDPADPCRTWAHHADFRRHAQATLEHERPAMYAALLDKLHRLYGTARPVSSATVP